MVKTEIAALLSLRERGEEEEQLTEGCKPGGMAASSTEGVRLDRTYCL
jgi:hypothetical protein